MKLLSRIHFCIQRMLLPALVEEMGRLSDKEQRFIKVCEVVRLESFLEGAGWCGNGRKPQSRIKIGKAFLAKALYNLSTTRALIDRLQSDTNLRRLCGWENGPSDVPDETTFSRAFAQFSAMRLTQALHQALITEHLGDEVIWHNSMDSTAIEAREKAHREQTAIAEAPPVLAEVLLSQIVAPPSAKPAVPAATSAAPQAKAGGEPKSKRKRGRPRKGEQPPEPDPTRLERHLIGSYQANLLDMPEVCCTHGCKKNAKGHTDYWVGYKLHVSTSDGGVPLATYLSSAKLHDSQAAIILKQSVTQRTKAVLYDLADAAYDAASIRAHSLAQGSVAIIDANKRRKEAMPMEPDRAEHYKARSEAERTNSHLKDNHGGRTVRVKGAAKVMSHLMFGIVVMSAEALSRLI